MRGSRKSKRMASCSEESPQFALPVNAHSEFTNGKRWLPTRDATSATATSRSKSRPQTPSVLFNVVCPALFITGKPPDEARGLLLLVHLPVLARAARGDRRC